MADFDAAVSTALENLPIQREVCRDPKGFVIHEVSPGDFRVYDAEPQAEGGFLPPAERRGKRVAVVTTDGTVKKDTTHTRTVNPSFLLVRQDDARGNDKIIGEVHISRAGRYSVVMVGKRIATSLKTFEEAERAALDWEPSDDLSASILNRILGF